MPDKKEPTDFSVPSQITEFLEAVRDQCHLLLPFTEVDYIKPMHKVSKRWVKIDPDPTNGDVYFPRKNDTSKVALTRFALEKLEHAAGIEWLEKKFKREDDRLDQYRIIYRTCARIQDFDGTYREVSAAREIDLRDGSAQIEGKTEGEIKAQRAHIHQLAESKSKNRVVREALGIKSSYAPRELDKPFLALKLVPNLDFQDPDIKRMYLAQMTGLAGILYPQAPSIAIAGTIEQPKMIGATVVDPPTPAIDIPATPVPPAVPVNPRVALIRKLDELYIKKLGKTRTEMSPTKPPLNQLSDGELDAIRLALEAKPDFVPPPPDPSALL